MPRIQMERKAEEAVEHYGVTDQVMKDLGDAKINLPGPPQWQGDLYQGQLPPNIDDLPSDDLSELLTVTTQWKNFLRGQMKLHKGFRTDAEKQVKVFRAYLRKQKRDTGSTEGAAKWLIDDELERDSRFQDIQREHLYFTTYVDILEACYEAAEADWNTVSRNITLRGQDREGTRRMQGRTSSRRSTL